MTRAVLTIAVASLCLTALGATRYYMAGPVRRAPVSAAAAFQMPGYAQSVYWHKYDAPTNASGYADYSAWATNYAKPAAGAAQPTFTNLIDGAVYLDGNDFLIGTNKPIGANSWCMNVWVNFATTNGNMQILSWGDAASTYTTLGSGFPTNGLLRLRNRSLDAQPIVPFPSNAWMMITVNNETGLRDIYTNSVLAFTDTRPITYSAQTSFLNIGQYFGGSFFFTGWLDEDYVATGYVFTAQDVTNMFENGRAAHGL